MSQGTILDEIVANKRIEVAAAKAVRSTNQLEREKFFSRTTSSLRSAVSTIGASGIIAEIKRRSPSKGVFKAELSIPELSRGYISAGASALSILTDSNYFGGSLDDLVLGRDANACPILRKDFVVDEYQLVEAKAFGADVVLLIAATLSPKEISTFSETAHSLGLEVLLEVHSLAELDASLCKSIDLVGVNNRDLRDFSVDIQRCFDIAPHIPEQFVKVAESGISNATAIRELSDKGFKAFLIGEAFMAQPDPAMACKKLIEDTVR